MRRLDPPQEGPFHVVLRGGRPRPVPRRQAHRRGDRVHAVQRVHDHAAGREPAHGLLPGRREDGGAGSEGLPGAVRPRVEQRRAARRDRQGRRRHRAHVPGEPARTRLLHGPVPHLQRVPRRRLRGRAPQGGHRLPREHDLEQAVRLPEGRGPRDHQQARDVQRVHPGRLGRPGQDVHRAGRDQVLRGPQPQRARPVPEEAQGQLGHVPVERDEQPGRGRPSALRRAVPHGSEPHARRHDHEHPDRTDQLGQLRPRRDRRVAQLPQRRGQRRQGGRQGEPVPEAPQQGHPHGRAHEGAHAVRHPGEQPFPRPAEPARARLRRQGRGVVQEARTVIEHRHRVPQRAGRVRLVVEARSEGTHHQAPDGHARLRLLPHPRPGHRRAQPPPYPQPLRHGGARRLPRTPPPADHPSRAVHGGRPRVLRRHLRRAGEAHPRPVHAVRVRARIPAGQVLRRRQGRGTDRPRTRDGRAQAHGHEPAQTLREQRPFVPHDIGPRARIHVRHGRHDRLVRGIPGEALRHRHVRTGRRQPFRRRVRPGPGRCGKHGPGRVRHQGQDPVPAVRHGLAHLARLHPPRHGRHPPPAGHGVRHRRGARREAAAPVPHHQRQAERSHQPRQPQDPHLHRRTPRTTCTSTSANTRPCWGWTPRR